MITPRAPRRSRQALGWAAATLLAAGAIAAIDIWHARDHAAPATAEIDPERLVPGFGPRSRAEALAEVDAMLAAKRALLAGDPDSWLRMEGVGRALLTRARLTASADDFHAADAMLARAVEAAPWPAGPVLSRAGAALMIHDLPTVERMLVRFEASVAAPTALEAAEAQAMRCEIAYERGELQRAQALCAAGGELGSVLRRANIALGGGDAATAARVIEEALRIPGQSPFQLCRLMLQRAAVSLATGDWPARPDGRRLPTGPSRATGSPKPSSPNRARLGAM